MSATATQTLPLFLPTTSRPFSPLYLLSPSSASLLAAMFSGLHTYWSSGPWLHDNCCLCKQTSGLQSLTVTRPWLRCTACKTNYILRAVQPSPKPHQLEKGRSQVYAAVPVGRSRGDNVLLTYKVGCGRQRREAARAVTVGIVNWKWQGGSAKTLGLKLWTRGFFKCIW